MSTVEHRIDSVSDRRHTTGVEADPVTTEVIRYALVTYAAQMSLALERTAFSPIVYSSHDYACALYDRGLRLLAQDQGPPGFSGVLGPAIRATVEKSGGEEELEPGDVLFSSWSYDIGGHANDVAIIVPAFHDGELVGYAANKVHNMDVGQKDAMLSIDTRDIWQEGTIFPGVKLYRAGARNDDIYRTIIANSRLPRAIAGDVNASVGAARVGIKGFAQLIERYGLDRFQASLDAMFDHSELVTRRLLSSIPDGRYSANGWFEGMHDDEPVPVPIDVEIRGDEIVVDVTKAPDQHAYPLNVPASNVVAVIRGMLVALIGTGENVNEGHFRPVEVRTRPGSMFHAEPPGPVALFMLARSPLESFYLALSDALPHAIPAQEGSNLALIWGFGQHEDKSFWGNLTVMAGGQGALPDRDAATLAPPLQYEGLKTVSCEVLEARTPYIVDRWEIAPDSAGTGRQRGFPGVDVSFRGRVPFGATIVIDRTKVPGYGLHGGESGRPNRAVVRAAGGETLEHTKSNQVPIGPGTVIEFETGGGGGYGPPEERDPEAVHADIREGYMSESAARRAYPHAFARVAEDDSED